MIKKLEWVLLTTYATIGIICVLLLQTIWFITMQFFRINKNEYIKMRKKYTNFFDNLFAR